MSLSMGQYYANPNNQFWRVIYAVYGVDGQDASYEEKVRFLLEHKIALWDIFHSADRKGAMDSDIKFEQPNNLLQLLQDHPGIRRILLAGKKAESSFRKLFPAVSVEAFYVPSTSPAFAKMSFESKVRAWESAIFIDLG